MVQFKGAPAAVAAIVSALLFLPIAGSPQVREQVLARDVRPAQESEVPDTTRHPFYFDNIGSPFGIGAQVTGEYEVLDDYLILYLDLVTLHQQPHCVNPDGRQVPSISFGVSGYTKTCQWTRLTQDAEEYPLEHLLLAGEEFNVEPFIYAIPIQDEAWLEGKWLTLTVRDVTNGIGEHYAHSSDMIFNVPPKG